VGTGGDGLGTFNISTVAAFVAAGAGVTVAKHGNRSASGRCGSADVLIAMGVNVDLPPERVRECVNRIGIGFLFAPVFHPAMRHAADPRREIGVRTIFNMLGPLTNPAGVRRQVIGAFRPDAARVLAQAAVRLAARRACVVHNGAGMDEVGLEHPTAVYEVQEGRAISRYELCAADFRLPAHPVAGILTGSVDENASIARRVLDGEPGPARDVVIANAALALYVAGRSGTMAEGAGMAMESIDTGRAREKLRLLTEAAAA
jgi:anthranilate phosphoribosyltransferase